MDNLSNLDIILAESDDILRSLALNEDMHFIIEQMQKRNKLIFQLLRELPVPERDAILPQLLAIRDNEDKALIPYREQLEQVKQTLRNIDQMKSYTTIDE